MTLYTVNVAMASGLDQKAGEGKAQLIMLAAISAAVAGGFAWGWLVDRIGPKRTLSLVLWLWVVTFGCAAAIGLFTLPVDSLFVIGALAGIGMGGIWAADRPYMLRLTPPERIGEFYGLYGMVGRFSAITGPLIWAIVAKLTIERGMPAAQGQGVGIVVLVALVFLSIWILAPVQDGHDTAD